MIAATALRLTHQNEAALMLELQPPLYDPEYSFLLQSFNFLF